MPRTLAYSTPLPSATKARKPDSGIRMRVHTTAEPLTDGYSRALFLIERRKVELRCSARPLITGKALSLPPDPRQVNPFETDAATLRTASRRLAACPHCVAGDSHASCILCHGSRQVEAWLDLQTRLRKVVTVSGEGDLVERHAEIRSARDFQRQSWPNRLLHQAYFRGLPPNLAPRLQPEVDPTRERILSSHVQTFVG